jgi:hypothetical protein
MDKENVAYIHTMEYSSVIKRNEIMSFAGKGIELEIIMLSKISRSQKDKYHIFSHLQNLGLNDMNVKRGVFEG